MNLLDRVLSRSTRLAAPLAGYPGVRLIGKTVKEALEEPAVQLEALEALEGELRPDIVFTLLDPTVEAEALGLEVEIGEGGPPSLAEQELPKLERFYELDLPDPESAARMPLFLAVAEGLAVGEDRIRGAYCTGPLTLLAQLLGREVLMERVKRGEPLHDPLGFTTAVVGGYAAALAARVDVVMVVDPAAEMLSAPEYRSLYRPYMSGLAGIVRASGAICLTQVGGNAAHLLDELSLCGAEGVCLGAKIDLPREAQRLPANLVLMGNIDPLRVMQRGTDEDVRWEVRQLLRRMDRARNFILSTGGDVPVDTPLRNLAAMMEEARNWRSRAGML